MRRAFRSVLASEWAEWANAQRMEQHCVCTSLESSGASSSVGLRCSRPPSALHAGIRTHPPQIGSGRGLQADLPGKQWPNGKQMDLEKGKVQRKVAPSPSARCFGRSFSSQAAGSSAASVAGVAGTGPAQFPGGPVRFAAQREAAKASQERKMRNIALYVVSLWIFMIAMTYLAVPLYRLFCQQTGYGGKTKHVDSQTVEDKMRRRAENPDSDVERKARERRVRVSFDATCGEGMPWRFRPTQREIVVRPGQSSLAFFTAENTSARDIIGVSSYNVQPDKVGKYFNKIQCFCFEEQKLRAGEKIDMPVFFYIDPEFASDPNMWNVDEITLGYTFFKVEEQESEEATRQLIEQAKIRAQRHAGIA